MLAMGDLYYYGARGLPQDHTQVLDHTLVHHFRIYGLVMSCYVLFSVS